MQCFASQLQRQRYDLDVAGLNRYRSFTLPPQVTSAEAYVVVTGAELARDPLGLFRSEHARQGKLGLPLDSSDLPLVSVIVRSMDRASLADALDSIALQTYQNIEVVVVNAKGSAHRALGERCGPHPLRLETPAEALDRAAAANFGLDAARGELLIFLDDDDLFLPHHVQRLHEELTKHADAVAAYAGVVCTDTEGKELRHYAADFDPLRLTVGNFIPIHAVLFRRSVLAKGARFDESLPVCEDWDFWLQLQQQGAFRFVRETGAVYRIQADAGSGVWADEDRNREVILRIYRKRLPYLGDKVLWGIFQWAHHKPMYDELAQTHEQVNQKLAAAHNEYGAALAEYKTALAGLEAHTTWADRRIADLDALHLAAHARIDALETLRRTLEARAAELEAAKDAAQGRIAELGNTLASSEAQVAQLGETRRQLEHAVSERERHIGLIMGSLSWRITQPLRSLAALFRKNKQG